MPQALHMLNIPITIADAAITLQQLGSSMLLLIDGDPTQNIRDIHKITTVIKGGKVYDPAAIGKALGIAPRHALK